MVCWRCEASVERPGSTEGVESWPKHPAAFLESIGTSGGHICCPTQSSLGLLLQTGRCRRPCRLSPYTAKCPATLQPTSQPPDQKRKKKEKKILSISRTGLPAGARLPSPRGNARRAEGGVVCEGGAQQQLPLALMRHQRKAGFKRCARGAGSVLGSTGADDCSSLSVLSPRGCSSPRSWLAARLLARAAWATAE